MKQVIRWPGVAAFVIFIALLATTYLLFANTLIKNIAIDSLEQATGAEVNINRVTHTLSPLSVTIDGVQLTDPAKPQNNQLQVGKLQASLEFWPLLMQKVIVNDLTVLGVKFNQLRDTPGQLYRNPEYESDSEGSLPAMPDMPDVDSILASSPLKTTAAIEQAQATYDKHAEDLKAQYEALPDESRLEYYKAEFEKLKNTDVNDPASILKAKEQFTALMDEAKKDKAAVEAFKASVETAQADVNSSVEALKTAPQEDYDLLKGLVAGDAAAIEDVTTMVFGDAAGEMSQYFLTAFKLVGPMLNSSKEQAEENLRQDGEWIIFDETSGLPDLWIKNAEVTVDWQRAALRSDWSDITWQHDLIGKPTIFTVDSPATDYWQSIALNGEMAFKQGVLSATQNWDVEQFVLPASELVNSNLLSAALESGKLTTSGELGINDMTLSGAADFVLSALALDATGQDKMGGIVASTLNKLTQLTISTDVSGVATNPEIGLSSDLNQQLGAALLDGLGSDETGQLAELRSKLNERVAGALGDSESQLSSLVDFGALADGKLGDFDNILSTNQNDIINQQKDELIKKLGSKLFGG